MLETFIFRKRRQRAAGHSDYEIFKRLLPSQNSIATSKSVAALYTLAFFMHRRIIMGFTELGSGIRRLDTKFIDRVPMNTHLQVAIRRPYDFETIPTLLRYAVTWSKQPCEDTPEGWRTAVREAKEQASIEYFSEAYDLWIEQLEDSYAIGLNTHVFIGS